MPTPFDDVDFPAWLDGSRGSASVIVPLVNEATHPRSVVDVGCGLGAWLAVFAEHGVDDVLGIDGPWVDRTLLEIPPGAFRVADLHEPIEAERRYDLALCLEVGQLLEPAAAALLVAGLTALSDVVVFSAAIPGQGGIGHLNEQWPAYWAGLFAAHSYVASDPLRARIWEEPGVKWWFAQNMVCFAAGAALERHPFLATHRCPSGAPLALVHPGCLAEALRSQPPAPVPRLRWGRRS